MADTITYGDLTLHPEDDGPPPKGTYPPERRRYRAPGAVSLLLMRGGEKRPGKWWTVTSTESEAKNVLAIINGSVGKRGAKKGLAELGIRVEATTRGDVLWVKVTPE